MKKMTAFAAVVLLAVAVCLPAGASDYGMEYNPGAWTLYESLFWGPYAPVKAPSEDTPPDHDMNPAAYWDWRWSQEDTSGWGAPFNSETKPWIPGVHSVGKS